MHITHDSLSVASDKNAKINQPTHEELVLKTISHVYEKLYELDRGRELARTLSDVTGKQNNEQIA